MDFFKTKKFAVLLIAFLGILVSAELLYIYFQANFNQYALASFCHINEVIDCDGVERSMLSQVFGIPFACWGIFLYSVIIFFVFVDKLKNIKFLKFLEVFKNPKMYIAALGYIAFCLSLILAFTAFVQIKKICFLCAVTYIFDIAIALICTDFKDGGIDNVFKTSVQDLIDGVKIKEYGISFAICVLAFAGFLYYTTSSFVFVPQLRMERDVNYFRKLVKNNPYIIQGNIFGDKNPKLIVDLYTDYECPICKINNIMLNKLVTEVKGVQINHRNLPLDNKCNKYLQHPFHDNSCLYAKYSVAAEKQNRWGLMNDLLFAKEPKNEDEIIHLAEKYMFDVPLLVKDANSKATSEIIKSDIDLAFEYRLDGTPVMIINGEVVQGLNSYNDLKQMFKDALAGKKINVNPRNRHHRR